LLRGVPSIVAPRLDLVGFLGGEFPAFIFGDPGAFADRPCGEQAKAGHRAANAERSFRHC
jgi:hypothetical protein